jgi:hypothetical protein
MAGWIEQCVLPAHGPALEEYFPGLTVKVVPFPPGWKGKAPVAAPAAAGSQVAAQPSAAAGVAGGRIEVDVAADPLLAAFDRDSLAGSGLERYAFRFWPEIVGRTAFLVWTVLRQPDPGRGEAGRVRPARLSLTELAFAAAGGNLQAITGAPCVCRALGAVEGEIRRDFRPRPRAYRQPGALERLQAEGLAAVRRRDGGRGGGAVYRVRVLNPLPLLAPDQALRLSLAGQREHARWLLECNLGPAAWERLTTRHLALPPLEWDLWEAA